MITYYILNTLQQYNKGTYRLANKITIMCVCVYIYISSNFARGRELKLENRPATEMQWHAIIPDTVPDNFRFHPRI